MRGPTATASLDNAAVSPGLEVVSATVVLQVTMGFLSVRAVTVSREVSPEKCVIQTLGHVSAREMWLVIDVTAVEMDRSTLTLSILSAAPAVSALE